jgi:hypothetical protein
MLNLTLSRTILPHALNAEYGSNDTEFAAAKQSQARRPIPERIHRREYLVGKYLIA